MSEQDVEGSTRPQGLVEKPTREVKAFLKRYRLRKDEISAEKRPYFDIAVAEWSHQRQEGTKARSRKGHAVPSAERSSHRDRLRSVLVHEGLGGHSRGGCDGCRQLLAAFGPRDIWFLRRRVRHELAQEIIEFVKDCGEYRALDEDERVDRLMRKLREATIMTAPSGVPQAVLHEAAHRSRTSPA